MTQVGTRGGNQLVRCIASHTIFNGDRVAQHFNATQLWLLLHLVGDSTTENQKKLRQLLEKYGNTAIKCKGLDQVKKDLETRIQNYYQGNRLDTYSARIIECIHESSGKPDESSTSLIAARQKLEDVPECHRGLKQFIIEPTILPAPDLALVSALPRSRPSSQASSAAGQSATVSQEAEEHCDENHIAIVVTPSPDLKQDIASLSSDV
jgi:hypothetical protein